MLLRLAEDTVGLKFDVNVIRTGRVNVCKRLHVRMTASGEVDESLEAHVELAV